MVSKNSDSRSRNWTFEVYPDSVPDNWQEILSDELHLTWVESPWHDRDLNPDGTVKKAHKHIVVTFEGKKSFAQVKEITDILHAPIPQVVRNMPGMIRYFIHQDNPEKAQYDKETIICHGGFEVDSYFAPSSSELQKASEELIQFIVDNDLTEFSALVECVKDVNREWLYILMNRNTTFFKAYMYNRAMVSKQKEGNT